MSLMCQKIFIFEGFEVVMAEYGQDGLDKIRVEKPTLVIFDVMMPRMNGSKSLISLKLILRPNQFP